MIRALFYILVIYLIFRLIRAASNPHRYYTPPPQPPPAPKTPPGPMNNIQDAEFEEMPPGPDGKK